MRYHRLCPWGSIIGEVTLFPPPGLLLILLGLNHPDPFPSSSIHKSGIHDDISLIRFVIPGSTEPAPYLIRGNPVFLK